MTARALALAVRAGSVRTMAHPTLATETIVEQVPVGVLIGDSGTQV